jgi:pimeloyl-ACP methyl ester carboxylesterase
MRIRDLGVMAEFVYEEESKPLPEGLVRSDRQAAVGSKWNAFQADAYTFGGKCVVAFRGTSGGGDAITDVALGVGMNSAYYEQGEEFVRKQNRSDVILCGHSLGGAIAQVVANRTNVPMVTFNAPGVAVLASRNILTANPGAAAVRIGGMVASAFARPGQALKDVKSAFNVVRGLNVCLIGDVVSLIGVHYGRVERILGGDSINPLKLHSIVTVNAVLATHPLGDRQAAF